MENKGWFWQTKRGYAFDVVFITFVYFYYIFLVMNNESNFPLALSGYILGGIGLLYIFFIAPIFHKDNKKERGFGGWKTLWIRTDNLKKSAKDVLLVLTSIMIASVLIVSLILGTFWTPQGGGFSAWLVEQGWLSAPNIYLDFGGQFAMYILWGFIQQFLFLSFILVRLRKIFPGTDRNNRIGMALFVGLIFGSYHLLNFQLFTFTLISGTFWAWHFYHEPNMFTVSISHGLGGTLAGMFVFNFADWHMVVGLQGLEVQYWELWAIGVSLVIIAFVILSAYFLKRTIPSNK